MQQKAPRVSEGFLKIIRGHSCLGLYFIKPKQLPKSPPSIGGLLKSLESGMLILYSIKINMQRRFSSIYSKWFE